MFFFLKQPIEIHNLRLTSAYFKVNINDQKMLQSLLQHILIKSVTWLVNSSWPGFQTFSPVVSPEKPPGVRSMV